MPRQQVRVFNGSLLMGVLRAAVSLAIFSVLPFAVQAGARVFSVRDYGAVSDGRTLDTAAINQAVDACAAAGGGRVLFPPGNYLSGTIHLKSRVELFLEAGATLIGATNLDLYHTFAATNPAPKLAVSRWHRGLIMAEDAHDIAIAGHGVIDGRHVFDPRGEERMRGPHAILLGHCRNFTLRDVLLTNAANYALLFFYSDDVTVTNATFAGGWDGVHFRGSPERWCHRVRVVNSRFYTGDDGIAGSYWREVAISNCVINSSCNGIRLIGPALDTDITRCDFFGPGLHEHRTSRDLHRTNMLAALCLQPSGWDAMPGPLDRVRISDLTIKDVTTPFHIVIRTNNTAGSLTIERVTATGAYRTACSVESWGETPFTNVVFRDVAVAFTGGGKGEDARLPLRMPGADARKLPAWGFYARGVKNLVFENVRFTCERDDARPLFIADGVERLVFDRFQCSRPAGAPDLFSLRDVGEIQLTETGFAAVKPRCLEMKLAAGNAGGYFLTGQPFSAVIRAENPGPAGLGKVELAVAGRTVSRWFWFHANETKEARFEGLIVPAAGDYEARCGEISRTLRVEE